MTRNEDMVNFSNSLVLGSRKRASNLNLVSFSSLSKRLAFEDLSGVKSLDMRVSHRGEIVSVGRLDEKIVFISYTTFDDVSANRRVFEVMLGKTFFRYVDKVSYGLEGCKISENDMATMARISLTGFEARDYTFSGVLDFNLSGASLNSHIFANMIYNLIDEIGYAHKLNSKATLDALKSALDNLNDIDANDELSVEERRKNAFAIAADWWTREDLYLSKRSKIRGLYHDLRNHVLLRNNA